MPGRHRRSRITRESRLVRGAVGALGAGALAVPLVPGVASADTFGPAVRPPQVHVPAVPGEPRAVPGAHERRGAKVVDYASEQVGRPYLYGGSGPVAYDCSGLTQYVYGQVGVSLPHSAAQQYGVTEHLAKSRKKLGDLLFFYDRSGIYHVGIYAGGDQMWAAGHTGDVVRKQVIFSPDYLVGRP